jgi:hypothetical protein
MRTRSCRAHQRSRERRHSAQSQRTDLDTIMKRPILQAIDATPRILLLTPQVRDSTHKRGCVPITCPGQAVGAFVTRHVY